MKNKNQIFWILGLILLVIIAFSLKQYFFSAQIFNGVTCSEISCGGPCKTINSVFPKQALCCGSNQVITVLNTCCNKNSCGSNCGIVTDGCGGTMNCGSCGGENPTPYCGDSLCNNGETCSSCSSDCGICACSSNWVTGEWGTCTSGVQIRTVTDSNNCINPTGNKPTNSQNCCTPNWQKGEWSICSAETQTQTRTVTDSNNCGVTIGKPAETQTCTITCTPNCDGKCGGVPNGCGGPCYALCGNEISPEPISEETPIGEFLGIKIYYWIISALVVFYIINKNRRKK